MQSKIIRIMITAIVTLLLLSSTGLAKDTEMMSSTEALEGEELMSNSPEGEDSWGYHVAFKYWSTDFTKSRIFQDIRGDKAFEGTAPVGGLAIGLSKGKHAVSLALLGTLSEYSAETRYTTVGATSNVITNIRDESKIKTLYVDIRLHRLITENINASFGYKYLRHDWEGMTHDLTTKGSSPYEIEFSAHGPGVGVNAALPIAESKFAISGAFFLVPYGWVTVNHSNGYESTEAAWLVTPEIGLRYSLFETTNIAVGYRWEANGSYESGPADIIHGPSFDVAISF